MKFTNKVCKLHANKYQNQFCCIKINYGYILINILFAQLEMDYRTCLNDFPINNRVKVSFEHWNDISFVI
jgi:hypothetical protein